MPGLMGSGVPMESPKILYKEFLVTNTTTNTYAEYYVDIAVDGYTPISIGYSSGNIDLNIYACRLRQRGGVGPMCGFVGFSNVALSHLSVGQKVGLYVVYIKT